MKKISFIALVFLLVLQSFIGPITTSANNDTSSALGQSFTFGEVTVDEAGNASIPWSFVAGNEETEVQYTYQSELKLDAATSGTLTGNIGSYTISVDGLITVTIAPNQLEDVAGSISVEGVETVAPVEEDSITEPTVEEPVSETVTEESKEETDSEELKEEEKDAKVTSLNSNPLMAAQSIKVNSMKFSLKIDEEELTAASALTMELEQNQVAKYNLAFDVDLTDKEYVAGDSFIFELPPSVLNFGNFSGTVVTEPGNPEFNYETVGQKVTVILKNDITPEQAHSNYPIVMEFESTFSLSGDELSQDIIIPKDNNLDETEVIALTFKPSTSNKTTSKTNKGFKIVDGERIIDWEIWVNEAGKQLSAATVEDTPDNKHEIVAGSVQVAKYDVGLNGVINKTGAGISHLTDSNFSDINLNGNNAYKITYKTKVVAESLAGNQSFTNTAILTNGPSTETAKGSQSITYGEVLAKNKIAGQVNNNYETNWEIKYNYNLAKIPAPTESNYNIKDTFPGPQNIDLSTIKVFKMDVVDGLVSTGNGIEISDSLYEIESVTEGFQLKFKDEITDAYRITYKAKYDVLNQTDFYTGKDGNLTNTVTNGAITKTSGHRVYQGILTKDYSLDLNAQKLTWTITIKADNEAISNLTFEDLFSEGAQTLTEGIDPTGLTVTGMTDQIISITDASKGFELTGGNIAKGQTATIKYTTDYDIETAGVVAKAYTNTANASWIYNGNTYKVSESKTYTPSTTTVNNGSKAGKYDYINQLFTWGIKVNFNKQPIEGAILKDNIGPGHEIIEDSFIIYDFTPEGGNDENGTIGTTEALVKNTDYTVLVSPDKKSFTLTFASDLDSSKNKKAYYVQYKTKDSDNIIGISKEQLDAAGETNESNYLNSASFETKGITHKLLSNPVKVNDSNHLVSKGISNSNSSEGSLTWTIYVNKSLSNIGEVVLTDTPSNNLMLISDSIEIAVMSISETKGVSEGTTWVKPTSTELTVNSDGSFKLNLGNLSKKAVQVRYKTFVLGLKGEAFNNLAKISYSFSDATSENQKNEDEFKDNFEFSRSNAFASANKGTVKLQKVGKDTLTSSIEELSGVKFQLIKKIANKEYIIKEATSGINGYFEFANVGYGDYVIKEDTTTTPAGYVGSANIPFTMSADTDILLTGNEDIVVEVINEKVNQAVKLTKVDVNDDKPLAGAEFTLYDQHGTIVKDKDNNELSSLTTNLNGEIAVNNLVPGSYYFEEKKAPNNYVFGASKKTDIFEIKENQTVFTEVTMKNARGKGEIVITKVDASNDSILIDGVKFELSNEDGSIKNTATTKDGIATFTNLPYDTYKLVEIEAHKDYLLDPVEKTIVLDSETGVNGAIQKLTVENSKTNRSVTLTKYNSNKSLKLKGAIFELKKATTDVDKDGNPLFDIVTGIDLEKLTTDDNGEISLKDLPVGQYQLIETKAPAGYKLDKTPVAFEIIEKQEETITLEKTNARISTGGGGTPGDPGNPGSPENPGNPGEPGKPGNPG